MFGFDEDLSAALCCLVDHLGLGCDFNAVSKALIAVLCCCLFFRGGSDFKRRICQDMVGFMILVITL